MKAGLTVAAPAVFGTSAASNAKTGNRPGVSVNILFGARTEEGQAGANDRAEIQGLPQARPDVPTQAQCPPTKKDALMRNGCPISVQEFHANPSKVRFGMAIAVRASGVNETVEQFKACCKAVQDKDAAINALRNLVCSDRFLWTVSDVACAAARQLQEEGKVRAEDRQQLLETLSGLNKLLGYLPELPKEHRPFPANYAGVKDPRKRQVIVLRALGGVGGYLNFHLPLELKACLLQPSRDGFEADAGKHIAWCQVHFAELEKEVRQLPA